MDRLFDLAIAQRTPIGALLVAAVVGSAQHATAQTPPPRVITQTIPTQSQLAPPRVITQTIPTPAPSASGVNGPAATQTTPDPLLDELAELQRSRDLLIIDLIAPLESDAVAPRSLISATRPRSSDPVSFDELETRFQALPEPTRAWIRQVESFVQRNLTRLNGRNDLSIRLHFMLRTLIGNVVRLKLVLANRGRGCTESSRGVLNAVDRQEVQALVDDLTVSMPLVSLPFMDRLLRDKVTGQLLLSDIARGFVLDEAAFEIVEDPNTASLPARLDTQVRLRLSQSQLVTIGLYACQMSSSERSLLGVTKRLLLKLWFEGLIEGHEFLAQANADRAKAYHEGRGALVDEGLLTRGLTPSTRQLLDEYQPIGLRIAQHTFESRRLKDFSESEGAILDRESFIRRSVIKARSILQIRETDDSTLVPHPAVVWSLIASSKTDEYGFKDLTPSQFEMLSLAFGQAERIEDVQNKLDLILKDPELQGASPEQRTAFVKVITTLVTKLKLGVRDRHGRLVPPTLAQYQPWRRKWGMSVLSPRSGAYRERVEPVLLQEPIWGQNVRAVNSSGEPLGKVLPLVDALGQVDVVSVRDQERAGRLVDQAVRTVLANTVTQMNRVAAAESLDDLKRELSSEQLRFAMQSAFSGYASVLSRLQDRWNRPNLAEATLGQLATAMSAPYDVTIFGRSWVVWSLGLWAFDALVGWMLPPALSPLRGVVREINAFTSTGIGAYHRAALPFIAVGMGVTALSIARAESEIAARERLMGTSVSRRLLFSAADIRSIEEEIERASLGLKSQAAIFAALFVAPKVVTALQPTLLRARDARAARLMMDAGIPLQHFRSLDELSVELASLEQRAMGSASGRWLTQPQQALLRWLRQQREQAAQLRLSWFPECVRLRLSPSMCSLDMRVIEDALQQMRADHARGAISSVELAQAEEVSRVLFNEVIQRTTTLLKAYPKGSREDWMRPWHSWLTGKELGMTRHEAFLVGGYRQLRFQQVQFVGAESTLYRGRDYFERLGIRIDPANPTWVSDREIRVAYERAVLSSRADEQAGLREAYDVLSTQNGRQTYSNWLRLIHAAQ